MNNYFQRKAIFAYCLMLVFGVNMVLHGADVLSGEDRLLFADGLYKRQFYKQAAQEYARYLEDYPNSPDKDALLCKQGEAYRLSGNKNAAIQVFAELAKNHSSKYNDEALLKLTSMMLDNNKVDVAQRFSEDLIKKNPSKDILAQALYLNGSALVVQGKNAQAIESFERLIRECPTSHYVPYAKVSLGSALSNPDLNQLPRAEKLLKEAISADLPSASLKAESYFHLGCVLLGMKKYQEAIDVFNILIKKYPNEERINDVYVKLAWSYYLAGMYVESSSCVVNTLESRGGFKQSQLAELRYIAANAFFEISNYERAIEFYKSVIKITPKTQMGQNAVFGLARSYYSKEKYAEAIDTLLPILKNKQLRENAIWLIAESAYFANRFDFAIQNYRILVNEFPESENAPDALYRVGCIHRNAGQRQEAATIFIQLSEKYPKSEFAADALFFAAHSYIMSNDDRALGLLKRFVSEHPNDSKVPAATYHIAAEQLRLGQNKEALDSFILIYSAYPNSEYVGKAYMWAGYLFNLNKEYVQAEQNLRKAITHKLSVDEAQEAKYLLAIVLQKQNKNDESINVMKGLLDNNVAGSFSPQHMAWLSNRLIDKQSWADAEKAAIKLASELDVTPAWKQTGWALAAKAAIGAGKIDEAETYYRNALNTNAKTRDYIECCYYLGELLLNNKKNFIEAEKFFIEAARLSADMPEFYELRIYSYIGHAHCAKARGDRDNCIRLLTATALLFHDENILPPVMEEVIGLLKEAGRIEEANGIIEDLIRMYPDSAEASRYSSEAK